MTARTQQEYQRRENALIMVRIVDENVTLSGGTGSWWNCQPQLGSVAGPSDDADYEEIVAWWPDASTTPSTGAIFWAMICTASGEWVLGARRCSDLE
jgi:hypothetical protein